MKKLAILGASGHGKVVAETASLCGWDSIVFFDDAWSSKVKNGHWSIVGDTDVLIRSLSEFEGVVVAIGSNRIRLDKHNMLEQAGATLVSIVHPSATISRFSNLGIGSVVFAHVVVNVDARIGKATILNTACTVDHDCTLGDAVHISPGAHLAGDVSVKHRAWFGIGACVKQGVCIGEDVVIGAGTVVIKDISDGLIVAGNPAKQLEKRC